MNAPPSSTATKQPLVPPLSIEPRRPSTGSSSNQTAIASQPTKTAYDESWDQYTLPWRPWWRFSMPFEQIVAAEYRGEGTQEEPYIVTWLQDDAENPVNWPSGYRWFLVSIVAMAMLAVSFAASVYIGAAQDLINRLGVSREVFLLGITLFVMQFGIGPLFWSPAAEVWGRRNIFFAAYIPYTLLQGCGIAAKDNIGAILAIRAIAGLFGSSPIANAAGTITDLFNAEERAGALALFAAAPLLGPALGPIAGSYLGEVGGYVWIQALITLFSGVLTILGMILVPETYGPAILRARAALLSKVTGKLYRTPMDEFKPPKLLRLLKESLTRPWVFLFREGMVLIITIYHAVTYGTLYMLFAAMPIVYGQSRGWSPGQAGLPFIAIAIGIISASLYVRFYDNPRYIRITREHNGQRPPPEVRLPGAILAGVLLVVSLTWFAASCAPTTHWIVPVLSGVPFGFGTVLVFLTLSNYLIDCYTVYAASCLAANATLRSLAGACFPLFAPKLYNGLGIQWAGGVIAFLALFCFPWPILFIKYGPRIRSRSKYILQAEQVLASLQARSKAPLVPPTESGSTETEGGGGGGEKKPIVERRMTEDGIGIETNGTVEEEVMADEELKRIEKEKTERKETV